MIKKTSFFNVKEKSVASNVPNKKFKNSKISLLWKSTVLLAYKKGHGQEYSVIAWNYGSRVTLLNINNVQRIE